jgi:hypothetical protein
MRRRIAVGLIALTFPTSALADFPNHEDVCVPQMRYGSADPSLPKIVSKAKLAKAILKSNPEWTKLYIDASERPSAREYAPQWRRIFTDPQFCKDDDPGCLGPPLVTPTPPPPPGTKVRPMLRRRGVWWTGSDPSS